MRIRGSCLFVLLVVLPGPGVAQAQTPNDFSARWPLQARGNGHVWHFEAGVPVLAAMQDPGFGDLQVFNAAGEAVPTTRVPSTSAATASTSWSVARFASSGPAEGAAGDAGVMSYAYRLPASLSVDAARITLGTTAASANVALQYRSGDTWATAARLTASGAAADTAAAANEVRFPQAITAHEWRLRSGMVLAPAPTVQFATRPVRFAFIANGAGPFTLAVGSPGWRRAEPAAAELARLRATAGAAGPPTLATLGARSAAPFVAAVAAAADTGTWRPWLAGGLLLAVAAVIVTLLLRRRRPVPA